MMSLCNGFHDSMRCIVYGIYRLLPNPNLNTKLCKRPFQSNSMQQGNLHREVSCTRTGSKYLLLEVALLKVDSASLAPQHASCARDVKHKPCAATTPALRGAPVGGGRCDRAQRLHVCRRRCFDVYFWHDWSGWVEYTLVAELWGAGSSCRWLVRGRSHCEVQQCANMAIG